jgi:hypothetical protein
MKAPFFGRCKRLWTLIPVFLATAMLASISCALPAEKLKYAHLGMSKENLQTNVGKPNLVRGTVINRYGQEVEVWEYQLVYPDDPDLKSFKVIFSILTAGAGSPVWLVQTTKTFWFYFVDSKLARWNEAGDWAVERDRLYELPWRLLEPLSPG